MKALRQLGFLKLPFRQEDPPAEEDIRVLTLFRNRAELKKAYGELQEEIYRLKDRIKQQEGATARVQEMLNALEMRLGIAESAYPALVFYQLRRLWQTGREIIEQFVADLVRMRDFYTRVLGFTVTDEGEQPTEHGKIGFVFLSRDPRDHHQIVLASGGADDFL